jgi:hypothetical protein
MAVASVLLGFLVPDWNHPLVVGTLLLFGIGVGLMSTPMTDAAVGQASGVLEPLAGMASGVFKMSSMLGSSLGVALFATSAKLFATDTVVDQARAAGLSGRQIATLRDALVDSKLAQRILSSLSPEARERVIGAGRTTLKALIAGRPSVIADGSDPGSLPGLESSPSGSLGPQWFENGSLDARKASYVRVATEEGGPCCSCARRSARRRR